MGSSRIKPDLLAEKLLAIRIELNLSQLKLAEELSCKKIKLRKSDISRYESGKREPSLIVLLRYARLADITMETLVDDKLTLELS